MSRIIHVENSVVAAVADQADYIQARKEADALAAEQGLRVADMPMAIQAMTQYPEVRAAIRPSWIDTISTEYHGLRDQERSYEVWHSVGSLATAEGFEQARSHVESNHFMPIPNDEWIAVGNGNYNGQSIARVHLDDLRRGNVPAAGTPYTVFVRLNKDNPRINVPGPLEYDAFMQDDRVLMAAGSPESREALAKMLFGRKETGGEGRDAVGSYHRMQEESFNAKAKGRLLFLGGSGGYGLGGSGSMYYDGRLVGVRAGGAVAQKKDDEESLKQVLASGQPIEEILRELYTTGQNQKERISRLETELMREKAKEHDLARIKEQTKAGKITLEGKEYFLNTGEERNILEAFKKDQEQIEKSGHIYVRTKKPKKKGKFLEFD